VPLRRTLLRALPLVIAAALLVLLLPGRGAVAPAGAAPSAGDRPATVGTHGPFAVPAASGAVRPRVVVPAGR
jgi:hypothetical protein